MKTKRNNLGGKQVRWHGWVGKVAGYDATIHQWANKRICGYKYHVELYSPLRIEFFKDIRKAVKWIKQNAGKVASK